MAHSGTCKSTLFLVAIIPVVALALSLTVAAQSTVAGPTSVSPLLPANSLDLQQTAKLPQATNPESVGETRAARMNDASEEASSIASSFTLDAAQLLDVQQRAQAGEVEAEYILGAVYRNGGPLVAQNDGEALSWFRKAADQAFPKAQRELGYAYATGKGVPQDFAEAARWYSKAAQQGDPQAGYELGLFYLLGRGVPRNESRASEWFGMSARKGIAAAQCALGFMYSKGQGVRRDLAQAFALQHEAAQKGFAKAQNELGVMYLRGEGTPQDPVEAARWFLAGAQQGDTDAQNNLGYLYDIGLGVKRNPNEAVRWVRSAAEHGDPVAQAYLGGMYAGGRGVPLDYVEAYKWFSLAASQNLPIAIQARDNLGSIMTPRQLSAAQSRISAWQSKQATIIESSPQERIVYLDPDRSMGVGR